MRLGGVDYAIPFLVLVLLSGCGFLPGFGQAEDPLLYLYSVKDVANQVSCEVQAFMAYQQRAQQNHNSQRGYQWVLSEDDVTVKLILTTDHQGYVSFTGIEVAKLGFESLAPLIAAQSNVPSLGAKGTVRRTRTAEIDFTVSPKPLTKDKNRTRNGEAFNCTVWMAKDNALTHLYVANWLSGLHPVPKTPS
jgi:hypothetical protein